MMNDRTLELIHREIDGLNSQAESSELTRILSEDSSAKKFYEDQKRISGILNKVTPADPPVSLKQNVMREVSENYSARPSSKAVSAEPGWFHWTSTVRIAVGMAAGILLMAIIWPTSDYFPINGSDASGTLVSRGEQSKSSTVLSQSSVSTSISWFPRESDVIFVLSTDGSEPATIKIASIQAGNIVRTITRDKAGDCQIEFENQSVVIQHSGKNAYTVVVERAGLKTAQIDFELQVDGRVAKTSVTVNW